MVQVRYTITVVGRLRLEAPVVLTRDGVSYAFDLADDQGLEAVTVTIDLPPDAALPTLTLQDGPVKAHLEEPQNPEEDEALAIVGRLEAFLGAFGVDHFALEDAKKEWLPADDAERAKLGMYGYTSEWVGAPRRTEPMQRDLLDGLLRVAGSDTDVDIVCSFFRIGHNLYHANSFIMAIMNFLLLVEYAFAEGKIKTADQARAYGASHELKAAIDQVRSDRSAMRALSRRDRAKFEAFEGKTTEEYARSLTDLRGFLFHQSRKDKRRWRPGKDKAFHFDADLLRQVCGHVCSNKLLDELS